MIIEKKPLHLIVRSNIYFDSSDYFCDRPYIYLSAHKESDGFWKSYTIGIGIRDQDDFDIGLVYETNEQSFFTILHELINWMNDHEHGITQYEDIIEPYTFFPDCECAHKLW